MIRKIAFFTAIILLITGCQETVKKNQTQKTDIQKIKNNSLETSANTTQIDTDKVKTIAEKSQEPGTSKNQNIAASESEKTKIKILPTKEKIKKQKNTAMALHNECSEILKNFVDKNGLVNYHGLKRKKKQLNALLDKFAKLKQKEYQSWPREEKIAFWINTYNIQMLKIITRNYPIEASRIGRIFFGPESIRNIKGIWTDYKFIVMDEEFTLTDIEKRIFDKEFSEPRVFLALSLASISGPILRNQAYYGSKLDDQLQEQTKKYIQSRMALKIDRLDSNVYLSAFFEPKWYGKYFSPKYEIDKKFKDHSIQERAVLNFITNYISKQDKTFLETENYSIKYLGYNWDLNDQKKP